MPNLVEIGPLVLEKKIFKICQCILADLLLSPDWKRAWLFIWRNMNSLYPKMICGKFGWNWSSSSGEDFFFKFVNVFSQIRNYLPLEKGGACHLNNIESPSPKDALCKIWLKLAQWFWRRIWKCEKFTTTTTTTTTTKTIWSARLTWAFGSGELKYWSYWYQLKDNIRSTQISRSF